MKKETKLQEGDYAKLVDYDDLSHIDKNILQIILGQEVLLIMQDEDDEGNRYFDIDLEFDGGRITLFGIEEKYLEYTDGTK